MATFQAGSSSQAVPLSATLSFPAPLPSLMGMLQLSSVNSLLSWRNSFPRTNGFSFRNLPQHAIICDRSLMSSSPTKLWFLYGQGTNLFCLLGYFLMAQAHHSISVKPWCRNKRFDDKPSFKKQNIWVHCSTEYNNTNFYPTQSHFSLASCSQEFINKFWLS